MRVTKEEFQQAWSKIYRNQYTEPETSAFNRGKNGYHYCRCWGECRSHQKRGCCIVLFLCENGLYEYDAEEENRNVTGITPKGKVVLPILERANTKFEIELALIMEE